MSSVQSPCPVLYYHLCPVRLYRVFTNHLINGTFLGKKKYIFLFQRRLERGIIRDVYWFRIKYPLFASYFNASLNFVDKISRNTCGRTDSNSTSQFCARALALIEECVPVMCTGCRAISCGGLSCRIVLHMSDEVTSTTNVA